jgi:hypothetical protein
MASSFGSPPQNGEFGCWAHFNGASGNCCGWATAEVAIVTDIATAINKARASRFILTTHLFPPLH